MHALRYSVDGIPMQPGEQKGLSLLFVLLVAVGQVAGGGECRQTDLMPARKGSTFSKEGKL